MKPLRSVLLRICIVTLLFVICLPRTARANTLTITSNPAGATVEINGAVIGTTPYTVELPGGYFHKTRTIFGARLEHPMVARVYKDGYTTQEIDLTEGPLEWRSFNGASYGNYWLLKADHFDVNLQLLSKTFTGSIGTTSTGTPASTTNPPLSTEQIFQSASPAIVRLVRSDRASGTGFFLTNTGVIATNGHVAEGESSLTVILPSGAHLLAKVAYIDATLDLALAKVDGNDFPHLNLADVRTVQPGQTVIAIGNPAKGMQNTITRGIVSAVGRDRAQGKGIWIQTDTSINPGNSGGPLLNTSGDVIGITTQKEFTELTTGGRPLQGIGFALSSTDLMDVLRQFYPEIEEKHQAAPPDGNGTGAVNVTSAPSGAEIYLDGKFVGDTPSTLQVPVGAHKIRIEGARRKAFERELDVLKGSQISLIANLEPIP
ncbi:MAG TPA: trypsin-like peptidase domain-containing protein [Candidatus Acidoferrales bacterium]|nr:trypsin-like peptidase domain-containing protein [Candidatus Acidoferrales bacterium]